MSTIKFPPKTKKKRGLLYIALLMACISLGLGVWQLYRLQWKLDLIEKRETALALPALNENELLDEFKSQNNNLVFQHVKLTGSFDPSKEIWIYPRSYRSRIGNIIYTPFKTKEGHWFLVQRGWSSGNQSSLISNTALPTTIGGIVILPPQTKLTLSLRDQTQKKWPWLDLNILGQKWDITWATPFIIALEKTNSPLVALGSGPPYRNMHLMYALTWFTLSFVLLIFYFGYRKR